MGGDENFESDPLFPRREPVQDDGVFAHVCVDMEEHLPAEFTQQTGCRRRNDGPVTNATADLDDHFGAPPWPRHPVEQDPPE